MDNQNYFNSFTELNLFIKMANIIDDAVKTKTGITASDLLLSELITGRKKKIVTSAVPDEDSIIQQIVKTFQGVKPSVKIPLNILKMAVLLYGSYAIGKRIANKVMRILGFDQEKRKELPDPYENLKNPYESRRDNIPNRSREVYPGFYEPRTTGEQWYQDMEANKFWEAGEKAGIPAQFGIEPGFVVNKNIGNKTDQFQQTMKKMQGEKIAHNDKNLTVLAQNFSSEYLPKMEAGQLPPDIAGFVNPSSYEQFLSQGAGQWASSASPSSAFFDPSGSLGRNKPLEWKPFGYGQDFVTPENSMKKTIEFKKEKLRQLNKLTPYQVAARSIYLTRLIDLQEKSGVLNSNEAAALRKAISQSIQLGIPEQLNNIEMMINQGISGGAILFPNQLGNINRSTNFNLEDLKQNPLENPIHQQMLDIVTNATEEYRNNPLYQNNIQNSSILS